MAPSVVFLVFAVGAIVFGIGQLIFVIAAENRR